MFKFCILILLASTIAHADYESDFQMRVSWVKTLKELMLHLEKKEGYLLVQNERSFFERLKLIDEAWADTRFNCFYGGWPSVKNGKYCQNPARTNSFYDKKACKEKELQCQPHLFGKGKCVPGRTQEERNRSFSNCEKKSDGNYEHLKDLSQKEIDELREMSILAHTICKEQKTAICKKVSDRIKDGLKAIERAAIEVTMEAPTAPSAPVTKPVTSLPHTDDPVEDKHPEDCTDPLHEHQQIAALFLDVAAVSPDLIYEKMKEEFQTSAMCDPMKIVNNPNERPSGLMLARLVKDLKEIDYIGNTIVSKNEFLNKLAAKWSISPDVVSETLTLLNQLKPSGSAENERKLLVSRIKGIVIQDFTKNPGRGPIDELKDELVTNHIFTKKSDGTIECPFVSKEAFMKAMNGRDEVLKKYGSSIKKRGQITIVDYSRPSNERRMFVLDLDNTKVLHNTWVAHGSGENGTETKGKDGIGSSPGMSNVIGSLRSSDGFVIAARADRGELYGPNVILKGIDVNNTNMASRSIVLHGWGSPLDSYTNGLGLYNPDTEKYDQPFDVVKKIRDTNFRNSSLKEMDDALMGVRVATGTSAYLNSTEGCLGVPTINAEHLDRKGRNKTQLELLREDLPGSLIFNYSGPDMTSKFF